MANYRLTIKAVEDLSEIWNYTYDNWSEKQADQYYQMQLDSCQDIAENRVIGKNYERIIKSIFGIQAGRHIIFYRKIANNQVEVTRIMHDRMDLKKTESEINSPHNKSLKPTTVTCVTHFAALNECFSNLRFSRTLLSWSGSSIFPLK